MNPQELTFWVILGRGLLLIGFLAALWRIGDGLFQWHTTMVLFVEDHNMMLRDYYERHPEQVPVTIPKKRRRGDLS